MEVIVWKCSVDRLRDTCAFNSAKNNPISALRSLFADRLTAVVLG